MGKKLNYCVKGRIYPDGTLRYGCGGILKVSERDAKAFSGAQFFFHMTGDNEIIRVIRV